MRCYVAVTFGVCTAAALHAQVGLHAKTDSPITIVTERKTTQTLADGTHIDRVTHEWFYRDSKGRTLTKTDGLGVDASATNFILVDPGTGESRWWLVGPGVQKQFNVSQIARENAPATPSRPVQRVTKVDDLGTQYVEGFPCQATRNTTSYPIDSIGNDRPMTTVGEYCRSREFGRPLKSSYSDPRSGTATSTVTSISREEPDLAVFQPPADYVGRVTTVSPVGAEPSKDAVAGMK